MAEIPDDVKRLMWGGRLRIQPWNGSVYRGWTWTLSLRRRELSVDYRVPLDGEYQKRLTVVWTRAVD